MNLCTTRHSCGPNPRDKALPDQPGSCRCRNAIAGLKPQQQNPSPGFLAALSSNATHSKSTLLFFRFCSLATVSDEATHILMCFIAVCPSAGESFTRAICAPSAAQEPIKNAWAASAPAEKQVTHFTLWSEPLFFFFFQKGATGVQNFPKASMCFYRSWPEKLPTPFILFEFFCNPPCVCVCLSPGLPCAARLD